MVQPGPGGVLKFETDHEDGVRSALRWVLGKSNEHPVTNKRQSKGASKPPTMREIKRACGKALTAGRRAKKAVARAPRVGPSSTADYYKGVRECLSWISSGRFQQPRRRP
jgi:hypothetical protein